MKTKVLILPGNSESNKAWADEWATALRENGFEPSVQYYSHWGTQNYFSYEEETRKISEFYKPFWGGIVVAKSIGSLLAVYATAKGVISPKRCVFFGLPAAMDGGKVGEQEVKLGLWLSKFDVPTDIFQNENDPITDYAKMSEAVKGHPTISTHSVPGDTHKYPTSVYLDKVLPLLTQ